MTTQTLRNWVIPGLLIGVTIVCLGLVTYDEVIGRTIDNTVQSLLAFVVGVLSNQLGNLSGGQQAQDTVKTIQNGSRIPTGGTLP